MTRSGLLIIVTIALLTVTTPLAGQWRAEPILPVRQATSLAVDPSALWLPDPLQARPASLATVAITGVAGAAAGTIGGAYLGLALGGYTGAITGVFVGPALTTPLLVHLSNGGRGSLSTAYISSALIAGAGGVAMVALGRTSPEGRFVYLAIPVAQVISAVVIERRAPAITR